MKLSNLLYIDTEMNGGARKRVIKTEEKAEVCGLCQAHPGRQPSLPPIMYRIPT
jgi:hypothetical protein